MRFLFLALVLIAAARSSATDTAPSRYNFGIVDGANQQSYCWEFGLAGQQGTVTFSAR